MTESAQVWRPDPGRMAAANLTHFMQGLARRGVRVANYAELYAWSISEPERFWSELAQFAGVRADWGDGPVLADAGQMPGARFFPDARLNFAQNLLRHRDARPALIFRNERGQRVELSCRALYQAVARVSAWLAACGVGRGDRVAAVLPNIPQACIGMLATAARGAIWSSCSPDFGTNALQERFGQIKPKVLFGVDGYSYGGKTFDSLPALAELIERLPSLERVAVVSYLHPRAPLAAVVRAERFEDLGDGAADIGFETVNFNDPLYILYSSGTTGAPKCIVHGVGGTLLQHQKEHLLHTDLKREDRLFYFTTCSWMMWNWQMSALACGTTLVLYDGSPFHPDPLALWRMAEQEKITVFGTSARYLAAVEKGELRPGTKFDLSAMRAILSTGSPLPAASYEGIYRDIKQDVQIASISGGTDIVSCFGLGCPLLPVYPGEIQCRGLGMSVDIFDEDGRPLRGEPGELVCTAAFPSMPLGFWNDQDGRLFHAAYFERYPNVWHHSDHALITEHDGLVILGRSDAMLKPGGVRIGTGELYSALAGMGEVLESLAVGQRVAADVRIVLFVQLAPGVSLDEPLKQRIRERIRAATTPRHVPARIIAVPDLPRTLSGKASELAVRAVIHGETVRNLAALANPETLEYFRSLRELET
ncbi:MAG TPA: acetoacetate--CoA ligase [Steroidobacteraceae bacterium]|jgi:acetoacetyl-CoA synthetase|nr:acetoacetate--CoA ligase [Steroidobacteraceae bacterium]